MKKKYPLVEVVWVDSAFSQGWHSHTTYTPPTECRTVGYLTHKTKECVNISMNVHEEQRAETMTIPRACVKSIRKVR